MTEQQWRRSADPRAMLDFVLGLRKEWPRKLASARGKEERRELLEALAGAEERRLRLFGVACCRRIWTKLSRVLRDHVEVAERHADGLVGDGVLKKTWRENCKTERRNRPSAAVGWLLWGPWMNWVTYETAIGRVALCANEVGGFEYWVQADLLRDVAGNPFRRVEADPSWRTRDVVALAEGIYEGRSFDRMPVLGDALEDAGCTNADVLAHCRGPGPHARGCWVADLLLGKG